MDETFSFDERGDVDLDSGPEGIAAVASAVTEDGVLAENQGRLRGRLVVIDYGLGSVGGLVSLEEDLARSAVRLPGHAGGLGLGR